jgi:IMP dehydrogenase/GMP reductase
MEERHMYKLVFIAGALAIFSAPALAGSAAIDKPIVVAEEGGVSVNIGDKDKDRDRDHHRKVVEVRHHDHDDDHHKVVEIHHRDRDEEHHHKVVVIHHGHDHDDHDHDHH